MRAARTARIQISGNCLGPRRMPLNVDSIHGRPTLSETDFAAVCSAEMLCRCGHRLAVLRPQEDRPIKLVAGKQRTQPTTFRADQDVFAEPGAGVPTRFAGDRLILGDWRCLRRRWRRNRTRRGRRSRRCGRGLPLRHSGRRLRRSRIDRLPSAGGWRCHYRIRGHGLSRCSRYHKSRAAECAESRTRHSGPMALRANQRSSDGCHRISHSGCAVRNSARGKLENWLS